MITSLTVYVQVSCFFVHNAVSQYQQMVNYPQMFPQMQQSYYPYHHDMTAYHPQPRRRSRRLKHKRRKNKSHKYDDRFTDDECSSSGECSSTDSESDDECYCDYSCEECMIKPYKKKCCTSFCESCLSYDQQAGMANQGIYFVPYPYPLVMTGVQTDKPLSTANITTNTTTTKGTRTSTTKKPAIVKLKLDGMEEETESIATTIIATTNVTTTVTNVTTTAKPKKKKKRPRPHDHHYHYEHYHDHYDRHHSHSHSHEHGKHHGHHNKNNNNTTTEKPHTTTTEKDKNPENKDTVHEKKDIIPDNKDGNLDNKDKNVTSNVQNPDKSYDPIQKLIDSTDAKPNIEIAKEILKSPIDASALRDLLEPHADKAVHSVKPGVNDIIFKVPGKGSTKYILTSLRRVKQNWMPKYGIVPIPDTVASDLMTQLRSMKVLNPHQEQKSPPVTKPTVLELANKLYRY